MIMAEAFKFKLIMYFLSEQAGTSYEQQLVLSSVVVTSFLQKKVW